MQIYITEGVPHAVSHAHEGVVINTKLHAINTIFIYH